MTRPWSVDPVLDALDNSNCPKTAVVLIDAPHCIEPWVLGLTDRGWTIDSLRVTGNAEPPTDRVARRLRHLQMRRLSQLMTEEYDRVLYLEDDTIVTPDCWSRLASLLDAGYTAASGVQRDRHGSGLLGVWGYDDDSECFDPLSVTDGIYMADAVGHYCLMTSGQTYANAVIPSTTDASIDRAHTFQMRPIAVDTHVWTGHLLPDGTVLR